ncbi:MAG TPA: hypothetical protein VL527_05250 [Dongiaceae bacterium]|jgi:hypothetical protein|nr:hypothetical protein [Dongiaceae bacterium]
MNRFSRISGRTLALSAPLLLALLLAGCASKPSIDWAARVGNYTSDQALVDFGPPDKQAETSTGTTVMEWISQPEYMQTYDPGPYYGYGGRHHYPDYYWRGPSYSDTVSYVHVLRLVFDANHRLTGWKDYYR